MAKTAKIVVKISSVLVKEENTLTHLIGICQIILQMFANKKLH